MHCIKRTRRSSDEEVRYFDGAVDIEMMHSVPSVKRTRTLSDKEVRYFDGNAEAEKMHSTVAKVVQSTSLHEAAKAGNVDLLQRLLASGYDVNSKDEMGMTPLMLAVNLNHFDAVKLLLDYDADVFVTDSADKSILEILLGKSSALPATVLTRVLLILKEFEADPDTKADILVEANCHLKIVMSLKDARITREFLESKYSLTSEECIVAIDMVVGRLDLENLYVLLHHGAGIDLRKDLFFYKLFDFLDGPEDSRNLQNAKIFLDRLDIWGDVIDDRINDFYLLFRCAAKDTVKLLLDCHVDVYFKNKLGKDLVAHLFENRRFDAIDLLRYREFDVNAKGENGYSALHFAAKAGSEKHVRYLLAFKADIEIKNDHGGTPLLEAVAWRRPDTTTLLLLHGANFRPILQDKNLDPFDKSFGVAMQEIIIAQLILEEKSGAQFGDSIRQRINSNKICKEIYEYYCNQISTMKDVKVWDSFTLFTAVVGNIEEIARYVKNEETAMFLRDSGKRLKIHPHFYYTLKHKMEMAVKMNLMKYTMYVTISKRTKALAAVSLPKTAFDMLSTY